jgi:hypothetical protein
VASAFEQIFGHDALVAKLRDLRRTETANRILASIRGMRYWLHDEGFRE